MVTTIISLILAFFKALPAVIDLVKGLQTAHQETLKANEYSTAIERQEAKKAVTNNAIAAAVAAAKSSVQVSRDTAFITKSSSLPE